MKKLFVSLLILSQFCALSLSTYAGLEKETSSANTLASQGIIKNDPQNYRLSDTITRKEVMKIVMKLSGKQVIDTCAGVFDDVINDWGCKYIESALENGFIALNDDFRPNDAITKTEAMKLVLKAKGIQKTQNTSDWQSDYMMSAFQYKIVDEMYYDFNADAKRGWIFTIATAAIEKQAEIQEKGGIMSDEVQL